MWDKKRGVVYPTQYSGELAELFGIYAGDGSLAIYRRGTDVEYRFTVSGSKEDGLYLQYVNSLVKNLFNLSASVKFRQQRGRNWAVLTYRSKAIVTYFEENGYAPATVDTR